MPPPFDPESLQVGDMVDATFHRARVWRKSDGEVLGIEYSSTGGRLQVPLRCWTFELSSPEEWPPRAGDIWADSLHQQWFFYGDDVHLNARTADGAFLDGDVMNVADHLLSACAPLRLQYRPAS